MKSLNRAIIIKVRFFITNEICKVTKLQILNHFAFDKMSLNIVALGLLRIVQ